MTLRCWSLSIPKIPPMRVALLFSLETVLSLMSLQPAAQADGRPQPLLRRFWDWKRNHAAIRWLQHRAVFPTCAVPPHTLVMHHPCLSVCLTSSNSTGSATTLNCHGGGTICKNMQSASVHQLQSCFRRVPDFLLPISVLSPSRSRGCSCPVSLVEVPDPSLLRRPTCPHFNNPTFSNKSSFLQALALSAISRITPAMRHEGGVGI